MLEHQKIVLEGVSFDKALFRKELIKSLSWLNEKEQKELSQWIIEKFSAEHSDIIQDVFYSKYNFAS